MKCSKCRELSKELDSRWDRVRLWFFGWFHSDIIDISQDKFTQGFSDGLAEGFLQAKSREEDIVSALRREIVRLQQINTFSEATINPFDVMTLGQDGSVFLATKKLTKEEKINLVIEAKRMKEGRLWQIFQETLKDQAHKVMFEKSTTFEDMRSGKAMLYNLGVQRQIVETLVK